MKRSINIDYWFGEEVILKTAPSQIRIMTGITIRPSGVMYELACGETTSWHQSVEIARPDDNIKIIKGFSNGLRSV